MPNWTRDDGTSDFTDASHESLNVMLDAVKRDADQFFRMGRFRAKKKLPNGATVIVEIRMPATEPGSGGEHGSR